MIRILITSVYLLVAAVTARGGDMMVEGWGNESLVYGEVTHVSRPGVAISDSIGIRPFGTLSGGFDAGAVSASTFEMEDYRIYQDDPLPRPGDKVMVILSCWGPDVYREMSARAVFMPDPHTPLRIVKGLSDVDVYDTLRNVRDLRKGEKEDESGAAAAVLGYWGTHSLVYGRIRGATLNSHENPSLSIHFRALLTISGGFDICRTPELFLPADFDFVRAGNRGGSGPDALVLLVRSDKSWAVASELAAFMPGEHSPICAVKDFSDPKVLDTLKAVQELRKKEKPAEKTEK